MLAYSPLPLPRHRHSGQAIFSFVASCLASGGIALLLIATRAGFLRDHSREASFGLLIISLTLYAGCIVGFISCFDNRYRRILALVALLLAVADFAAIALLPIR
ncbi:MAG: hypothetical protein JWO87_3888 [Phycisphaerales bacterium]|nr:hypothetical protein [Phycisphaerales bacterium]MDB5302225.1 hypothetical protein [Phycisphaerales bacterium]